MTVIAWSKVVAIQKGFEDRGLGRKDNWFEFAVVLADGVWTKTDVPYEEAAAQLREIEASRMAREFAHEEDPGPSSLCGKEFWALGHAWICEGKVGHDPELSQHTTKLLRWFNQKLDDVRQEGRADKESMERVLAVDRERLERIGGLLKERDEWKAAAEGWVERNRVEGAVRICDEVVAKRLAELRSDFVTKVHALPIRGGSDEVGHFVSRAEVIRAIRDAETGPMVEERDLIDLLEKFARGTGGRRSGELIRRGWLSVGVTYEGMRELRAKDKI